MARIRWHGSSYAAKPIRQLPNGDWLMEMQQHGPRFGVGTQIQVTTVEIDSMDAAEMPDAHGSLAVLEKAMAEERKTIPSVRELLMEQARQRNAAKAAT